MNEHEPNQLTPDGEARREAMLDELVGAMQRVHRGRRVRRRAASALAVLTIFVGIAWVIGSQSPARPEVVVKLPQPQPQPQPPDVTPTKRLIQMVDDDELLALLAQLDRPAGIVRSEGEIWLTTAVTDAELGLTTPPPEPEPVDPSTM